MPQFDEIAVAYADEDAGCPEDLICLTDNEAAKLARNLARWRLYGSLVASRCAP